MANFRFFEMATVRHVGFSKLQFWMLFSIWSANARHHVKFRENRSNGCGDIAILPFYKMVVAGILDFQKFKFYRLLRLVDPICVSLPNFIKIGQYVSEIWRIFDFSRWRLSAMLDFKIAILNILRHRECQCASSCEISWKSVKWLQRYCDFSVFQNGDRRHLGFLKVQILNGWHIFDTKSALLC